MTHRALYTALGVFSPPFLVARLVVKSLRFRAYRQNIGERFGFVPAQSVDIWIHCVSVGEFRAAIALINRLRDLSFKILLTTTTPTGRAAAREYYPKIPVCYFPFDIPWCVRNFLRRTHPKICILVETEIWPNLIHILEKRGTPIFLINARLSDRSCQKYQKFARNLSRETLCKITKIIAQDAHSARNFAQLGAAEKSLEMLGNLKFDQNFAPEQKTVTELLKIANGRRVVVFASTHENEERQIIRAYLKNPPDALAILVPRHPDRFHSVFAELRKHNLRVVRRSENPICDPKTQFLLGDSMGELAAYYAAGQVVFVGGSLDDTGGHNMLEAAALGKPIIFGPNLRNFQNISDGLCASDAAILVEDADELMAKIHHLLENSDKCRRLGENAFAFLKSHQGAAGRILKMVLEYFPNKNSNNKNDD